MEVAVDVTDRSRLLLLALFMTAPAILAEVLPEDRADALYHYYDGGGVKIDGPSILVRKGDSKNISGNVNYYVDSISSASIDVVTQGSPYEEQRTQWSGSVDYLHADTMMTVSYSTSDESDYTSDTFGFSMSQSLFGDLTTVSIGYTFGDDTITSSIDSTFKDDAQHQNYHISLSQVLTRKLVLSLIYDGITDEGYLQSPYRSTLVLNDPDDPSAGFNFNMPERYPRTRTSNAASANLLYHLPYRATVNLGYRFYTDDWSIDAHTAEIGYTHPLRERWILDVGFRYYTQSDADFYADLFERPDQQNFMARDKELSRFQNYTLSFGVSYNLLDKVLGYVDKATLNLKYDRIWFQYDNFSDVRDGLVPPTAPGYDFSADVFQIYGSVWY